jgi:putative NADH-flavin reductase
MNLLVLGATGNTGREIVDLALRNGHLVTAFVRSPGKIERRHARLVVRQGQALDASLLSAALDGQDAVLSALGLPPRRALRPSHFMTDSATCTIAAMQRAQVTRLAILSAAVLFPGRGLQYAFFSRLLKHHARDLAAMEAVIGASGLDWTVARPTRLVRSSEERYRACTGTLPEGGSSISFRATAAFMLTAVERGLHHREIVGVTR